MPNAERKLLFAALVVAGVTGTMAFVGGSTTWRYYLTVEECRAEGRSLLGKRIRVTGTVLPDSLSIVEGRTNASFTLKGTEQGLSVVCAGPSPTTWREACRLSWRVNFASRGGSRVSAS